MEKYYVSGCRDDGEETVTCDDTEATFWTLYTRDDKGLSQGIIDLAFREDAEAAMVVYVEREALQEQVQKLETAQQRIAELESERSVYVSHINTQANRADAAEAEIVRRDKPAGEAVSFDSLRDAVAEMTGGILHEFSDGLKGHDAVPFINFNSLKRIVNKFSAQPAALPWHVDSCSNCGSKLLSWDTTVVKNTAVQDGLLKLNEVSGLFYLGCDECSETLLKVSADDVANHLNNAKAKGFTEAGD